jgi:ferritin-like metal-binding protein YciE
VEEAMGLFSKDIRTLEDLFLHGLQDIYYAENRIVKSLPMMIENVHDAELKRGLQQHLRETENQVKRVEQVFRLNDQEPSGTKCPGIDGILSEGEELMGEMEDKVMNVGIVAAAQAVEHYEMTRYGTLIAWAKELGRNASVPLLAKNLDEEKAADAKLSAIAERRVNPKSHGKASAGRARTGSGRPSAAGAGKKSPARRTAASRKKAVQKKSGTRGKKKATSRRSR